MHNAHVTAYYRDKLRKLRAEFALRAQENERRWRGLLMSECYSSGHHVPNSHYTTSKITKNLLSMITEPRPNSRHQLSVINQGLS